MFRLSVIRHRARGTADLPDEPTRPSPFDADDSLPEQPLKTPPAASAADGIAAARGTHGLPAPDSAYRHQYCVHPRFGNSGALAVPLLHRLLAAFPSAPAVMHFPRRLARYRRYSARAALLGLSMTMLGLHTGTLALSVSLIATLLAVGNLVVWRQTREQAMLWWAAGSLTIAVATTVSQLLPAAVLFAYLPIALTLCFYWIGIQSFQRRALQKARIAIYAGACAVVFLGFAASGPANDYYRVSIVAVLIASLSGACAYELLTRHRGVARDASRFVGMLFSINALIFVLFSLYAPPADADIATLPDSLRLATYAAVLTLVIGWNFGFVMMVMQRYLDVAIELSTHDDLTGVLNRRAFSDRALQHLKLAERGGATLSVLAMDLDHFKRVNDAHGHQAGDAVLREFVRVAQSCLRYADQLGRVGGEEFVAILPATQAPGALIVAERLRQTLAETPIRHGGKSINVSVSIGVAQFDSRRHDLDALLEAADAALYGAKHRGRNCVELAPCASDTFPSVQLTWDGQYNSGHAIIDSEHASLFRLVNQLIRNTQEHPEARALCESLTEMLFWLSEHFRHEEAIFVAAGWSGAEEHMRLHQALEARGQELLKGIEDGSRAFGDLFDFLIREVVGIHLAQHDAAYFPVVAGRA
jgi:diguanylate cyclase (GGDEF)-like protein/hemerythrin-like metal-binding protein